MTARHPLDNTLLTAAPPHPARRDSPPVVARAQSTLPPAPPTWIAPNKAEPRPTVPLFHRGWLDAGSHEMALVADLARELRAGAALHVA